jgi:hypothetical protein
MHGFSGKIHEEVGPELTVLQCLWCGARSVKAQSRLRTDWLTLLHLIPLFRIRNVYVRCSACNRNMIAKCAFGDLDGMSSVTLHHHLVKSQSFVGLTCIVLGVLLCWAPMIGIIPACIGFCYRKQFSSALRVTSAISLAISVLVSLVLVAAMLLSQRPG